jgi:HlyD family secretion protein
MTMPTLFTLAQDLKKMEVIVSVDEADVGNVKDGQVVLFTVDAYPDKTFEGVIKQVRMNSQIVSNVVTYETVVTVDNSQLLLRPGMTVSADITTKVIKGSLHVPNSALRFSPLDISLYSSTRFTPSLPLF